MHIRANKESLSILKGGLKTCQQQAEAYEKLYKAMLASGEGSHKVKNANLEKKLARMCQVKAECKRLKEASIENQSRINALEAMKNSDDIPALRKICEEGASLSKVLMREAAELRC